MAAGLAAGRRPQMVFLREDEAEALAAGLGLTDGEPAGAVVRHGLVEPPLALYPVAPRVAARLSALETPPAVMAVFPLPERRPLGALIDVAAPDLLVVYADGIADPGNMGTLLRAAAAFGAAAVVTGRGSADLYGPKVVRASMGAVFGPALVVGAGLGEVVAQLGAAEVYGLAAHGGVPLPRAQVSRPAVLAVGAERAGLSAEALDHVTSFVTIPLAPGCSGAVESLNAGVAGAIALYELSRRGPGGAESLTGASPEEG